MILSMLSNRRSTVIRSVLVAVALLLWLVVGAFGGIAQGQLSQVQQNDAAAFLPSSAESTRAAEARSKFVEGQALPVLVVLTPEGGGAVSEAQFGAVQGFTTGIADRPVGAEEGTWAQYLDGDPIAIPSEDGEAMMIIVSVDGEVADDQLGEEGRVSTAFVEDLRDGLAEDLGATASTAGDLGLNAWVTGPGGYVADLVNAFAGIDGLLLLVALGAVLLILLVIYRSPFLPFVVIVTAVFALALAGLAVYHLADAGVLVLNGQAQGILSILVVGASVDYALLLVARYREELRAGDHPAAAMRRAMRASVEPILASAGTVAVGLLCLLLSDLASNRSLGPVAALGIVSAVLGAFTFLPALLLLPGRRARVMFWPRTPRPRPADAQLRDGIWTKAARLVTRNSRMAWVVTTIVLLAGAAFIPTLQVGSQSQSDLFLTEVDSVPGEQVLAEHFPAGAVQPAFVIAPEADLADVAAAAQSLDGVETVAPYTGAQTGQPGAASDAPAVVIDGLVRVDVTTREAADTAGSVDTIEALRDAVHAVSPDALVGGAAAESLDTRIASQRDLMVIVPVVLIVILLILMLLFRSVVAAVLLLAVNLLSFGATMGVSAIVFNHVLDLPGVDYAVPLYGFVFLVALGVDYSIFLMTRAREESMKHGTRIGIERALSVTGGVITSAGVILAATFAALGVIPLLFLAQLAFIVAFGVLIDTFVVRSILVPALVTEIGDRTWWPSALARGPIEGKSSAAPSEVAPVG